MAIMACMQESPEHDDPKHCQVGWGGRRSEKVKDDGPGLPTQDNCHGYQSRRETDQKYPGNSQSVHLEMMLKDSWWRFRHLRASYACPGSNEAIILGCTPYHGGRVVLGRRRPPMWSVHSGEGIAQPLKDRRSLQAADSTGVSGTPGKGSRPRKSTAFRIQMG
jgi:hypothetical protein